MRSIIITLLTFCTGSCFSQNLKMINDSTYHFSIGVPESWRYGTPKDKSLALIALRQKESDTDVPRENFNVNIFDRPESTADLNSSYSEFLQSIGTADGFTLVEQKDTTINGRIYKFAITTHIDKISKEKMHNMVLFSYNRGEIFILTMVSTSEKFSTYQSLFERIAMSLKY